MSDTITPRRSTRTRRPAIHQQGSNDDDFVPPNVPSAAVKRASSDAVPFAGIATKKQRVSVKKEAINDSKVVSPCKMKKHQRPTPAECEFAVLELGRLHPSVLEKTAEIIKNRTSPPVIQETVMPDPIQSSSCGYQPSIMDGVVSTMLSQNTTAANSTTAFANLRKALPDWNQVAKLPSPIPIETAVRVAGLAKKRAHNIWTICRTLLEERGEASLEYLRKDDWAIDDIKAELMRFPGMGKKTVSCVLMFTMGREDEFPVDTHVHRISMQHKWIPSTYSRDDAYDYLNTVIPNHLKMDLHCLLVQHGRECHRCAARGKPQFPPKDGTKLQCPLVHLHEIAATDTVPVKVEIELKSIKQEG
jgi:endonuclease-3